MSGGWTTIGLRLTDPQYLSLLGLIPFVILFAGRSLAGLGSIRRVMAIGARCGVLTILVLALAGVEQIRVSDKQTVIFVIDESASVPRDQQRAALDFVKAATRTMRAGQDRVAVLSFDGAAMVEQLPGDDLRIERAGPGQKPYQTDLAAALRLAMAIFPPDTARRLVVLSDGNETLGDALTEAGAYAAANVPIDVAPLRYERKNEMLVERLSAPAAAKLEETINLKLIVRAQAPARARVLVYHNDALIDLDAGTSQSGSTVSLDAGANRFTIPVPLRVAGAHQFRALIQPEQDGDDGIAANNEGRAFTIVGSAERVLILTERDIEPAKGNDESTALLGSALRQAGIENDVALVEDAPLEPSGLAGRSLVILSNVSAFALSEAQQRSLAAFVRDLGGGLIAVGGDRSFSVGGYQKTPLEEVLPVETDRAKLKFLSMSMVIVIDRSGSMMGEKLDMAKSAARAAVKLFSSLDRVGVVAFDSFPEWIAPLGPCLDKALIMRQIDSIGCGGGTSIYPALEQALGELSRLNTNLKHVILLTDGQSAPGDFEGIARDFAARGITISAVAVGPDADRDLLARLAKTSGGRMYVTNSAQPLPQIFVHETVLASRSGLYERKFTPQLRAALDDQVVRGFVQADFPPLEGYVVGALKPQAHAPLIRSHSDGSDPVLAYWQVGLGRTIAFTSGMWQRWGPQWTEWPGFSKFWAQCVRYAARPGNSNEFRVTTSIQGDEARLLLEAQELPAIAASSVLMAGQLVGPDFSSRPLEIHQTGPGRFEGSFRARDIGSYIANIAYSYGAGASAKRGNVQTGVVVTYSPEHAAMTHNEGLLAELARRTGGRMLDMRHPEAVYEPWGIRAVRTMLPAWDMLLRLAIVAFLIDVAIRRLALQPMAAARGLRERIRELAGATPGTEAATVATLRSVRARGSEERDNARELVGSTQAVNAPNARDRQSDDELSRVLSGEDEKPAVARPTHRSRTPQTGEAEYTSRLLRAKREAKPVGDDQVR